MESQKQDQISGKELEFTYNLGDKFRVTIDKEKLKHQQEREQKAQVAQEESKKQFEELKKQLEGSVSTPSHVPSSKLN